MTPTLKRVRARSRINSRVTVFDGTTCEPEGPAVGQKNRTCCPNTFNAQTTEKALEQGF
jgi:hypothetical protein